MHPLLTALAVYGVVSAAATVVVVRIGYVLKRRRGPDRPPRPRPTPDPTNTQPHQRRTR